MTVGKRKAEAALAVAILTAGVLLFRETYSFSPPLFPDVPGPAALPRMVLAPAIGLAALVLLLIARARRSPEPDTPVTFGLARLAAVSALVALYVVLLPSVGFEVVTLGFLAALLLPMTRSVVKGLLAAVGITAAVYVVFILGLGVHVPMSFLPRIIRLAP